MIRDLGFLLLVACVPAAACGSSVSEPPDPVAVEYCTVCGERPGCPTVIDQTINAVCSDQTRAYYVCLTDNACGFVGCEAEWQQRQVCFLGEDAGVDSGAQQAP